MNRPFYYLVLAISMNLFLSCATYETYQKETVKNNMRNKTFEKKDNLDNLSQN